MPSNAGSEPAAAGVNDVLITAELASRPSPPPDYEAESRALGLLAHEMATNPCGVLQKCAELVMELCHADSAGISILEASENGGIFRWHAAAGAFAPNLHGSMPEDASPCGTVMERDCVLLFKEPERLFPALQGVEPRIYENLLAPWHVKGKAAGTLWAIKHAPEGRFNAEDARVLQSLARFSAAAFQMTSALDEAAAERSALRASEEQYRDALDTMSEGFALFDADFTILDVNAETVRLDGRPREALVGRNHWEAFPGSEESPQGEMFKRVMRDRVPAAMEHSYRWPDGRTLWLDTRAYPTRGGGIAILWRDITDRKQTEEALRESEERYRAILATALDYAIFTTDANGIIDSWPPGAQAVFGWDADEAIGQPAAMTYTEEDRANGVPEWERRLAQDEGVAPNVRWHLRKDGRRVFIEGAMRPIVDRSEGDRGFLKVGRDATDRKHWDERQQVLLHELQHRTRNVMTVVLTMFEKTRRGATDIETLSNTFRDRLSALARVQGLLSRLHEGDRVAFDTLIHAELSAMGAIDSTGQGERVVLQGPSGVLLRSSSVQTFALALHELATNASKYGALAQENGRLSVRWRVQSREGRRYLHIEWIESCVDMPCPESAPRGTGYGRELIERALPYQLEAETRYELGEDGIKCTIELPISDVTSSEIASHA